MKSADTLEPMKKTSLIRKVAIAEIQRWHPKAQTRGFLREIRAAFHDVAGSENLPPARRESDDLPENLAFDEPRLICAPGFQPDLHEFDRSTGEIWVYAIEDETRLSDEKLRRILGWWFAVDDALGWTARLIVTDRYGKNERELPLSNLYFELILGVQLDSAAATAIARQMGISFQMGGERI